MSPLPNGWVCATIGELVRFNYGKGLPDRERSESGFPVYGSNGIIGRHREALVQGEALVIGRKGSVGEVHHATSPSWPIDTTYYVDNFGGMPPRFWYYRLRAQGLESLNRATAIPGLSREDAYLAEIPLPPLPEQRRIADKLDALLTRVDACRDRLDRIPAILKRFRQSVLNAATAGELTKEWRKARGDSKGDQQFAFDDADAFRGYSFPSGWSAHRLIDIASVIGGITKDAKKQGTDFEELPYLRVANVQRGFLDMREVKTIRVPPGRVSDWLLRTGDILFNEGGDIDKLGRGWIWSGELPACVFQNHVFRARLFDSDFEPRYFSWYGNSRGYDYFLARGKQTTNLASINRSVLAALPVAAPPAAEQAEIVRRVIELFGFTERLEQACTAATQRVRTCTPSLLARAFRGELVPQDPNDEPASELLERIRNLGDDALRVRSQPDRRGPTATAPRRNSRSRVAPDGAPRRARRRPS